MTRALDLSWRLGGRALGEDPEWRQMYLAFLCYANKMLRALASLVQLPGAWNYPHLPCHPPCFSVPLLTPLPIQSRAEAEGSGVWIRLKGPGQARLSLVPHPGPATGKPPVLGRLMSQQDYSLLRCCSSGLSLGRVTAFGFRGCNWVKRWEK